MAGGGKRKTWLSNGDKQENGKEMRTNLSYSKLNKVSVMDTNPHNQKRARPYAYTDSMGAVVPALKKFMEEHRFFKVPVKLRDGKKGVALV